MPLAGPRLCCLIALLLLGCCTLRTSADPTATSSTQASSSATAAAQSRPNTYASVTGGDADKKHFQMKAELDSSDDSEYNEDSASLKSTFGLGPNDLPDADVDPVLFATGMDSSAGSGGSSSAYDKDTDSSSDSPVSIAIFDGKRGKKHYRGFDADLSGYDSHSTSKGSAAASEELLQAFDALDESDKQHHKQQHKQNRLGWVLGRHSAKARDSHKDAVFKTDHDSSSSSSGGGGGGSGGMVGAAFVERRIKPLLAAIKSRAPNLVGRGRNRKYTRAEVEEIVKIMSIELNAKQGQHSAAGSSSSSSSSKDFDHASSSSSSGDGYLVLNDSPATTTSSSDEFALTNVKSSSSSSSSSGGGDAYDQDSAEPYDDAYAEQRFKELVQGLRHHKKGTPATDTYPDDTPHSSHGHVHTHPHMHVHKSHAHSGTADTDGSTGATDKHSAGKGTVYEDLSYSGFKDAKRQKHKHDSSAYTDADAHSATFPNADKTDKPPAVFHKVVKKTAYGAAHSDAKKHAVKARKATHGSTHAYPVSGVVAKVGLVVKPKHKKPYSTVPASTAAKRAAHKAGHAKRAQFLDSSEMEDIKTILEAIYDKENSEIAAEVTGEEAAALAEIQAVLQPHIITDDPESYALAFNADASAEDSIPSEQPTVAGVPTAEAPVQQPAAPTPAELPEKPAAAAPAAAPTLAPAAQKTQASDKKAPVALAPVPASKTTTLPTAAPAPAPAKKASPAPTPAAAPADKAVLTSINVDADGNDTEEVVYEIEYVETEDANGDADLDVSTTSVDDADTEVEHVTEVNGNIDIDGVDFETIEGSIEGSIEGDNVNGTQDDAASSAKVALSSKDTARRSSNSAEASSAKAATATHTAMGDNKSDKSAGERSTSTKEGSKRAGEGKAQKEAKVKAAPPTTSSSSSSSYKLAKDRPTDAKSELKAPQKAKAEEVKEDPGMEINTQKPAGEESRKAQSAVAKSAASSNAAAAPKPSSGSSSNSGSGSKKAASKAHEEEEVVEVEEVLAEVPAKPVKDSKSVSNAQQPRTSAPAAPPRRAAAEQQQQQQQEASVVSCTAIPETAIHNCAVCLPSAQGAKLECQYCTAGYYRESLTKCTLCPKGAFCGRNERVYCKEGYSTEEEGNWSERQCKVCAPGFGAVNAPGEKLKCQRCRTGTFTTHGGTHPCQQCPPLTMSIDMVTSGAFGEGGTTCLACPAGLVPNDSNTGCRCPALNADCACPKGWVSILATGNPPCVKCGAGNTYAAVKKGTNIKACAACPRGSVATDGTDCVCSPGYFSQDGTAFVPGGCVPCPADSISASRGSTKCLKCAPNTVPNVARTECVRQQQAQ